MGPLRHLASQSQSVLRALSLQSDCISLIYQGLPHDGFNENKTCYHNPESPKRSIIIRVSIVFLILGMTQPGINLL